jgi:alkylation response protein AidB-like acyl-CoA dehydrogenase
MAVTSEQTTSGLDLPERAQSLQPLLIEHSAAGDEAGRLADEVVEALHREGLWGMWVPKVLGGSELDQESSLRTIEALTYGDPSVGWVHMAASLAIGTGGAYLGDEAADALFSGDRFPVITGQGTRPGVAVPTDGGFSLSGSWSFASGIKHSTHIHTLALVEGTGEPRICVLPVEQATLVDNWDVLGLRATGSIDYTIDSVFVPESCTHFALTEAPVRGGPIYGQGVIGFALICHTGWALGIGRRMLDELIALVQGKAGRPGAQSESDSFAEGMERAEGAYRAARAFVFEVWADARETLERGDPLSLRQHTLLRLATTHATWAVHDVGMFVYLSGGTTALREGPIQRLFRDLHAGTQHLIVSPLVRRSVGRELTGLAEGKRWQFVELVDA